MGIMAECSCAVVQVDGMSFLCLLRGQDLAAVEAPFGRHDLSGSPLDGALLVSVMPGGEQVDFCWASLGADQLVQPVSGLQAGVAAAIAARLYGLAPGLGRMLGRDLADPAIQVFLPPEDAWWHGTWKAGPIAGTPGRFHATMVMHGEMVIPDAVAAGRAPIPPPGPVPQD